jgi:RHS repeat-associated protein
VAQDVDGAVTTFAWDWATGIPEMLSDGRAVYIVGHDTLGWEDAGGWTYAVPDALGSVRQAVDATAAVVAARAWSPYGVEVGDAPAGLGYTGEWWDAVVGLQYLRARWMAPRTSAFLTRDAIEQNHPYQYAAANPVRYADPSGHDAGCPGQDASACGTYVDDVQLLNTAVLITAFRSENCIKDGDVERIIYGDASVELGTVIDAGTAILTHDHFRRWNDIKAFSFRDRLGNDTIVNKDDVHIRYRDGGTQKLGLDVNLQTALISQEATLLPQDKLPAGYSRVQVVHYQNTQQFQVMHTYIVENHVASPDFPQVSSIHIADPDTSISGGDSGGGVFYDGRLTANTWNIVDRTILTLDRQTGEVLDRELTQLTFFKAALLPNQLRP